MIKLLYIIPSLNYAGAQIHVLELSKKLIKREFEITVCTINSRYMNLRSEFIKLGIKLKIVQHGMIYDPRMLINIYNILKSTHFDILHIHDLPIHSTFICALAKLNKIPVVICTIHGLWKFSFFKYIIFRFLLTMTREFCHKYIVVSQATKLFWKKYYNIPNEKILVIPNGVDINKFKPISRLSNRFYINKFINGPIIGCIGSLSPVKGQTYLIQAMPKILNEFPTAKLVLIGDGELKDKLQSLCYKLNLNDQVLFYGLRKDVHKLLPEFDCVVLPSGFDDKEKVGESCGLVLLEAMAAEIPVVATKIAGIPEIVKNGITGILVPPGSTEALSDAVITILKNKRESNNMGKLGRKKVEREFSLELLANRMDYIYNQLLNIAK